MKIGVLIHGVDSVDFDAYVNHLGVLASLPNQHQYAIISIRNTKVCQARNKLIELSEQHNFDKLLFIDTDHIVPNNIVSRLLKTNADIVSGLICKRRDDYCQVGYVLKEDNKFGKVHIPIDTGVYDVDVCAFGCTMIDCRVFDKLKKPYFYDNELRSDVNFCLDVKRSGGTVKIDSGLICGHIVSEPIVVYPFNNHKVKDMLDSY